MGFGDWTGSYLLTERLQLGICDDDTFLRFIEMTVHPLVLRTEEAIRTRVDAINQHLTRDGLRLEATSATSGYPVFKVVQAGLAEVIASEPTGWELVDRQVGGMRTAFNQAETEEAFQGVGLLGREAMISLAQAVVPPEQAVVPPEQAVVLDGVDVGPTDAARRLEWFIGEVLPGKSNEHLRPAVEAIIKAANGVTHDRSANPGGLRTGVRWRNRRAVESAMCCGVFNAMSRSAAPISRSEFKQYPCPCSIPAIQVAYGAAPEGAHR